MQGIGQRLVNETNLFYNDKAHYFKQLLPDASSMVTWKDVESCMNRPELYNFEMIGPDNLKIEIPMSKKAWVFAKPVQDKAFMFEKLHQGCGFVIDLPDLGGRQLLEQLGHSVFALCEFEGD
jgi:hypothetical protein